MKEILYIKVFNCSAADKVELFQIAETFKAKVIDYGKDSLLLEFVQTATKKRCSCEADERGIQQDRSRARRKRRYRVDQCDGAVKERTFLRERKEYYHNYVKKRLIRKSVYQYIYEHRQTAKQQIVQDLTMGLSMHSGTLEHICIDPEGPECYCASFY